MNEFDDVTLDKNSWSYGDVTGEPPEWGPIRKPRLVTASTMINPLDDLVRTDATAGAVVLTLETAVGCDGRKHTFKKIDASANAMTIDGAGTETIDGALTSATAVQYGVIRIESNGANWDII